MRAQGLVFAEGERGRRRLQRQQTRWRTAGVSLRMPPSMHRDSPGESPSCFRNGSRSRDPGSQRASSLFKEPRGSASLRRAERQNPGSSTAKSIFNYNSNNLYSLHFIPYSTLLFLFYYTFCYCDTLTDCNFLFALTVRDFGARTSAGCQGSPVFVVQVCQHHLIKAERNIPLITLIILSSYAQWIIKTFPLHYLNIS